MTTIPDEIESLERVCKELDDLTLEYLSQLNQYTQDRTSTTGALQKGFLDLAHAKYTMGAKAISHLSYDERMKAQVQLLVDHENKVPFTITRPPMKDRDESTATNNKDEEGLRLRKETETKGQQKNVDDVTKNKSTDKKEKKAIRVNGNPLHWFGLLVSPSLRTSQGHFQTATTHLIDLANMIHNLDMMEQRYKTLKMEKRRLLEQRLDKATTTLVSTTIE